MADKQSLEFTSAMTSEAAAGYLEALAAGLRQRHVSIESGQEFIGLNVTGDVELDIDARLNDKGRASIELGLSWRIAKRQPDPPPPLVISSSTRPEPQGTAEMSGEPG